jgi:hypothetical protein
MRKIFYILPTLVVGFFALAFSAFAAYDTQIHSANNFVVTFDSDVCYEAGETCLVQIYKTCAGSGNSDIYLVNGADLSATDLVSWSNGAACTSTYLTFIVPDSSYDLGIKYTSTISVPDSVYQIVLNSTSLTASAIWDDTDSIMSPATNSVKAMLSGFVPTIIFLVILFGFFWFIVRFLNAEFNAQWRADDLQIQRSRKMLRSIQSRLNRYKI